MVATQNQQSKVNKGKLAYLVLSLQVPTPNNNIYFTYYRISVYSYTI